jgi:hypothetical protein
MRRIIPVFALAAKTLSRVTIADQKRLSATEHSAIITSRRETMATAKEHIVEIIKRQPDDSSYDDIVRELAFDLMVQRGLKDSDERRTISNEEMERRIKSWQK